MADSPALCECRIEVEGEVYARIRCVATIPAQGRSHLCDQTRAARSETRRVGHDEEYFLLYGELDLGTVEPFAVSYC